MIMKSKMKRALGESCVVCVAPPVLGHHLAGWRFKASAFTNLKSIPAKFRKGDFPALMDGGAGVLLTGNASKAILPNQAIHPYA